MNSKQKLELAWLEKEDWSRLEARILLDDLAKNICDSQSLSIRFRQEASNHLLAGSYCLQNVKVQAAWPHEYQPLRQSVPFR